MAVIMISELPGAGPGFADVARQQGLFDKMKSAPGFMGHWSGATDTGYRVFEVRESPEVHQAWLDPVFAHGISLGEPAGSADVDVEEVQRVHLFDRCQYLLISG